MRGSGLFLLIYKFSGKLLMLYSWFILQSPVVTRSMTTSPCGTHCVRCEIFSKLRVLAVANWLETRVETALRIETMGSRMRITERDLESWHVWISWLISHPSLPLASCIVRNGWQTLSWAFTTAMAERPEQWSHLKSCWDTVWQSGVRVRRQIQSYHWTNRPHNKEICCSPLIRCMALQPLLTDSPSNQTRVSAYYPTTRPYYPG